MEYSGVKLHNSITVGKIFSIHYFEYMNNFKFSGEAHNFWELVYIDKGLSLIHISEPTRP